jgi:hypothetical protein
MIAPFHDASRESWEEIRARMLGETELYLEDGLRHPERAVRIPAVPVGSGSFSPHFARSFWAEALGIC